MKKQQANLDYDYEHDILYVRPKNREYDNSAQIKNFIIDFDVENLIVGIEILDASKLLKVPKNVLKNIKSFKIQIDTNSEMAVINLELKSIIRNRERVSSYELESLDAQLRESPGIELAT